MGIDFETILNLRRQAQMDRGLQPSADPRGTTGLQGAAQRRMGANSGPPLDPTADTPDEAAQTDQMQQDLMTPQSTIPRPMQDTMTKYALMMRLFPGQGPMGQAMLGGPNGP